RVEDDPLRALALELLDLLAEGGIGLGARDIRSDEDRTIDLTRFVRDDRLRGDVVIERPRDRVRSIVLAPVLRILLARHALLDLPLHEPVVAVRDVAVLRQRPLV